MRLGVFGKIFQRRVDNFIKRFLFTDGRKKIFAREKNFVGDLSTQRGIFTSLDTTAAVDALVAVKRPKIFRAVNFKRADPTDLRARAAVNAIRLKKFRLDHALDADIVRVDLHAIVRATCHRARDFVWELAAAVSTFKFQCKFR